MSFGVTPTGFVKKTLAQIVSELQVLFQSIDPNLYLGDEGLAGQLIGLLSKRESDLWDGQEAIYGSRNINEATGASLDNLVAELGLLRIDASKTKVYEVLLWGDAMRLIPAGSTVRQSTTGNDFTLDADITLSATVPRAVVFDLETISNGKVYSLTVNGSVYSYTATVPSDTLDDVGSSLVSDINTGEGKTLASYASGVLTLNGTGATSAESADFTLSSIVGMGIDTVAKAGIFTAVLEGVLVAPIGTLNTIQTPVSGWDTVTNPIAGVTGRNAETDDELRSRATLFYLVGKATEDAIRTNLLNNVDGIISASVTSNRTPSTDGEGRPAHSYECVVEGGTDTDVAQVIWNSGPAGIQPYGTDATASVAVVDSTGATQYVGFSRPTELLVWVKVQRGYNTEETYPASGDDAIKTAIQTYGLENLYAGIDLIRQRLAKPIYTVPGVGDINILIGDTTDGSTPSTYTEVNVTAAAREAISLDTARIIVEDLP